MVAGPCHSEPRDCVDWLGKVVVPHEVRGQEGRGVGAARDGAAVNGDGAIGTVYKSEETIQSLRGGGGDSGTEDGAEWEGHMIV